MNAEEYAARQASIIEALIAAILQIINLFRAPRLSPRDWQTMLVTIYPYVQDAREQSARLGREFYDSQREQHHPELPRHDTFLPGYSQEQFIRALEPVRRAMSRPGAPQEAAAQVALYVTREVEQGGRRTILRAVDEDPVVQGWARVATGRETCAFCLTLISRGPVYLSAGSAGLDLDDTSAVELIRRSQGTGEDAQLASEELQELMDQWHVGCDCKVVPVFDRRSWPGRDEFLRAEQIWLRYSRMVDKDPDLLIPQNGNQLVKGSRRWSRSEAVIAAIRRAIASGDVDMLDYAIAA
jgi:uncharacterized protein YoaH (UPF0181 family)